MEEFQNKVRGLVIEKYAAIAKRDSSGCAPSCCGEPSSPVAIADLGKALDYSDEDLALAPGEANLGLGCGNPISRAALKPGETVLDLGSGAGFDAFLAARQVGPSGRVIGVDMTPAMLERARANAARAGLSQVEFREGRLEALPVETG